MILAGSFIKAFMCAFNGVFPIILLIVLGYFLKRKGFFSDEFLNKGNSFVFKVCLPCLLFINVYAIESFSEIDWKVVIYSELALLLFFSIGILIVKLFIEEDKQKGVVLQCIVRSNYAIIGIPLAAAFGGEAGEQVAAILGAFSIPTLNVFAVLALSVFIKKDGEKISLKSTIIKICKNPLIIGVVLGLLVIGIRSLIPTNELGELAFSLERDLPFIYKAIKNISSIASPLALFILGGKFSFNAVKGMLKQISIGVLARIVVVPATAIFLAVILDKTNVFMFDNPQAVFPAFIALFGSPVAVSSAIMAQDMDNDGVLAGQLVVWTSVFSILTIVILVTTLGMLGYIAI